MAFLLKEHRQIYIDLYFFFTKVDTMERVQCQCGHWRLATLRYVRQVTLFISFSMQALGHQHSEVHTNQPLLFAAHQPVLFAAHFKLLSDTTECGHYNKVAEAPV